MGVGIGGKGAVAPLDFHIFIHDTDNVEVGLMVLFFGHVFSVAPPPLGNFSADALDCRSLESISKQ